MEGGVYRGRWRWTFPRVDDSHQPCPIHSYSRDLQHGPRRGHDTFYQLGDCSSVGVRGGVMFGMIICLNVDEVEVEIMGNAKAMGC